MTAATIVAGLELAETYRLVRQLGKGGMGEVWEAEHLRLPKKVAVKFLIMAGQGHPELESRFQREAEIASGLKHPHIIDVHDFNVLTDGTPYIIMEHLRGQDLRARLKAGPLSLEDTLTITRQTASALGVAHAGNVVHRDLKPENIFLCESHDGGLHAKVLDFGISKLRNSVNAFATQEHSLLGTPGYMSPEQAMGKHASLDGRADLFSLATIVYEMLTGHSIFAGDSLAEIVYKVVHHSPPPLAQLDASVPSALSAAVAQALEKDPDARQPSIQGFVSALDLDQAFADTAAVPHSSSDLKTAPSNALASPTAAPADVPAPREGPRPWHVAGGVLLAITALGAYALTSRAPGRLAPASSPTLPQETHQEAHQEAHHPPKPKAPPGQASPGSARLLAPTSIPGPVEQEGPGSPETATADSASEPIAAGRGSGRKISAQQAALLGEARQALASGQLTQALQRARSSLRFGKTPEAFETLVAVYCEQHDVGMAQAMLRNLRGSRKRRAARACRKVGLKL